ncbi:PLP-dependent aminotransferase family protein [Jonesia quinghaiensis]|uniref:MocR-like pyridoxine biosynthesis transcription factor PdxR n=1 Tax=Jonesia quinghaiensis TaxID=262806 RepID=UPI00048AB7A6|nr:PLP-dependent aminotransferase family protein [Jonesia quinghaiensis]
MGAEIPVVLDRSSRVPLATQIAGGIRGLISVGRLAPGQALPSTRSLAQRLSVARGTVVGAYDQLVSESYLVSTPGGATRVHPGAQRVVAVRGGGGRDGQSVILRGGVADGGREQVAPSDGGVRGESRSWVDATIDDSSWREAWRRAATSQGPSSGSASPGLVMMREAVAEHLQEMRSMAVDPERILITAGAREGLMLVLAAQGAPTVAVESPGYPGLHRVLDRLGTGVVPVRSDAEGIVPQELPDHVDAVLVTPNHVFPAGGAMPAPRRMDLLAHAGQEEILVIEDDLDADYRHVGPPLPTLWDLAPDQVIHLGTFNQVLTPEVRIGYLIAPPAWSGQLRSTQRDLGLGASAITQRAVATFLESGGLRRRIIRRRRDILRRREVIAEVLSVPVMLTSGAHAVISVEHAGVAREVVAACAGMGVDVQDLSHYWGRDVAEPGVVVNYVQCGEDELREVLRVLAACIGE